MHKGTCTACLQTGWEKTRKGRVLARKSEKGALYLQFVTDSGQVVSTANIVGNLTPAVSGFGLHTGLVA